MERKNRGRAATACALGGLALAALRSAFELRPELMPARLPEALVGGAVVALVAALWLGFPWVRRVRARFPVYFVPEPPPTRTPEEIRGIVRERLRAMRDRARNLSNPVHYVGRLRDLVDDVAWVVRQTHRASFVDDFRRSINDPVVAMFARHLGNDPSPGLRDVRDQVGDWLDRRIKELDVDDLNPDYDGGPLRRRITRVDLG